MTNITQHIGLAHQPTTKRALPRAAAAKQKTAKNLTRLDKILKIPVTLYT